MPAERDDATLTPVERSLVRAIVSALVRAATTTTDESRAAGRTHVVPAGGKLGDGDGGDGGGKRAKARSGLVPDRADYSGRRSGGQAAIRQGVASIRRSCNGARADCYTSILALQSF